MPVFPSTRHYSKSLTTTICFIHGTLRRPGRNGQGFISVAPHLSKHQVQKTLNIHQLKLWMNFFLSCILDILRDLSNPPPEIYCQPSFSLVALSLSFLQFKESPSPNSYLVREMFHWTRRKEILNKRNGDVAPPTSASGTQTQLKVKFTSWPKMTAGAPVINPHSRQKEGWQAGEPSGFHL